MSKKVKIIIGVIVAIILVIIISLFLFYSQGLKAPKTNNGENAEKIIQIESGSSTLNIINNLKQNNIIKNEFIAKIYIKLHDVKSLKAGKYKFEGNEALPEVLNILTEGKVMDETVTITFLEGKNMRYIASQIADNTNNTTNDVYNLLQDNNYITSVISKYWFVTEDIQKNGIYYPLEGYLYPDTYSFENADVDVKTIFEKMLDKMDEVLEKNKEDIENSKISVHNILTMASIVELEGNNAENRPKVASVIYNRLKNKMSIGSDVTTYYGIKVDMGERDLYAKEINTYNQYNTRGPNMAGKLPIGPIASVSEESINAVLNPAKESYLYFVADKNGELYFSNTNEEHEQTIQTLKKKGLWYEYE